jgi:hypothetical protein
MNFAYYPFIVNLNTITFGVIILYHTQILIFGYLPFKEGIVETGIFL